MLLCRVGDALFQLYGIFLPDCGQTIVAHPGERDPEETAGLIIGGTDATYGSAPWMAMLYESRQFCGGVLIDKSVTFTYILFYY